MIQHLSWWLFAALLPIIYWRLPVAVRPALLSIASLAVLIVLAPFDLLVMILLSFFVYGTFALSAARVSAAGAVPRGVRQVPGRGGRSFLPVILVLAYLFWYKYAPPFEQLMTHEMRPDTAAITYGAIPFGISYFSFKLIHYAIERGRGMLPDHEIDDFMAWIFLMPTFASGPIERFEHFLEHRETGFRWDFVVEGGTRIAQGLVKKFALIPYIADLSYRLAGDDWVAFTHHKAGLHGAGISWAYLALELTTSYLDFSAYSDIAIGASRLFGLRIMENFNYPFLTTNLPEFWRRYHMTLTNWCRAYIYMPMLGYTRNPYVALTATFVIVGLWHAGSLNWLLWGFWHGLGQAVAIRWGRFAQRNRITFFKTWLGRMTGRGMTIAYVMLGCAFEAVHDQGTVFDALRLMTSAFGI